MAEFNKSAFCCTANRLSVFCTFLAIISFLPTGYAQRKNIDFQNLVWVRYNHSLQLSQKWKLVNEVDERRYVFPGKQHQLLFRTNLLYTLNEFWNTGGGFTYFLQSPHDPKAESKLMVPELRPHQELNLQLKLNDRWSLKQRYKLEERFFRHSDGEKLLPGYEFNFRMRFKFDVFYTFLKDGEGREKAAFTVSDEVMMNAGKNIVLNSFDQNRIYGGIRYNTGAATAIEAGYLLWFQQRPSGTDYFHRNILRLSVFHKMSLPEK